MSETAAQPLAAGSHPELGGERLHLAASVEALQKAVDAPLKIGMGDFAATLYMESYRAWRRQELREAVKSPYFARIDFVPDDRGKVETYYIGKTYFADGMIEVIGWQAPVAALFYRSTASRSSYVAPMGEIAGAVQLKRRFVVEHSQLKHIADDLDERPLSGGRTSQIAAGHTRDDLLRQVLSELVTPWLRDIIVTLQGDQYALITAPADRVLVIQGVAGSGKTSIALHRLSYLVYPSLVAAKVPPRCIVFGPNRLFLKYVSAVLPKLGLQHDAGALRAAHAKHAARTYPFHRALFTEDALLMVTSLFDNARTPAEVDLQLALGRKRLEQADELRKEARRIQVQLAAASGAPMPPRERNEKVLNPAFSLPTGYGKPP